MKISDAKYESLLDSIRQNLKAELEAKFKVGELVDQAIRADVPRSRLAKDLGRSWTTLDKYRRTWLFWKDTRVTTPVSHGILKVDSSNSFGLYEAVAIHWPKQEAEAMKRAARKGGNAPQKVIDEIKKKQEARWAEQREDREREAKENAAKYAVREFSMAVSAVERHIKEGRIGGQELEALVLLASAFVERHGKRSRWGRRAA